MNALYFFVAIAVVAPSASAATCDECMSTFTAITTKACTDVTTAWACLLTATDTTCSTGDNTPLKQSATKAAGVTVNTVFDEATTLSCPPSAVCTAQAAYATSVAGRTAGSTTAVKCSEAMTYAQAVGGATSSLNACDSTTTQSAQYDTAMTMVKADCGFSYAVGLRPSVVILAIALFLSVLKF